LGESNTTVARAERNIQFLLGDILNYGDDRFGEQAAQIQDDLGYDYGTLADLKWVAKRIPKERRDAKLPWSHHRELAKFEPEEQKKWLAKQPLKGGHVLNSGILSVTRAPSPC